MLAKTKKNRFGNNVSICMHGSFMGRDEPFYLTPGSITLPDCRYCQYRVLRSHWSSLRRRGGAWGGSGASAGPRGTIPPAAELATSPTLWKCRAGGDGVQEAPGHAIASPRQFPTPFSNEGQQKANADDLSTEQMPSYY